MISMRLIKYEQTTKGLKNADVPIIFLAGPTVRASQPHIVSWRLAAIEEFEKQNFEGIVIVPEFTVRIESDLDKGWIPRWEFVGLKTADAILFWIPRTLETIGLTTNYELGYWLAREPHKVVYGRPEDAYRISYLDIMHCTHALDTGKEADPIHTTLESTISAAIVKARENFPGKRHVNGKYGREDTPVDFIHPCKAL